MEQYKNESFLDIAYIYIVKIRKSKDSSRAIGGNSHRV